jgi:outer membrane protein OmpA-like peptidoglycan-associated protein
MQRLTWVACAVGSLWLSACATVELPPAALLQARDNVAQAQNDNTVQSMAPQELKTATDTLSRAEGLFTAHASTAEVSSQADIASTQARTAQAVAHAKQSDQAVAGAALDRQRARADARTQEARQANVRANNAEMNTAVAMQNTAMANQSAADAQKSAADAQKDADAMRERMKEMQAQTTERGTLVTLGDVLFETNRAEIRPSGQGSLRKLAEFLSQFPERQALIEGHTDNVGTPTLNESLSARRADSVAAALVSMGVSGTRLKAVGLGQAYPLNDNASDSKRALNRRVEIYISESGQAVRARR